jgi:hypothetical protein
VAWQQARLISNIDHLVIQLGLKQQKTMELVEIVNEIKEAIKYSQRPSLHSAMFALALALAPSVG